jgi:hypothetical protein
LARNKDNVLKWVEMSICGMLFQWVSTIKNTIKHVGLVQIGPHHHHLIEINLFSLWYSWKIAELALNNNHSLKIIASTGKFLISYKK